MSLNISRNACYDKDTIKRSNHPKIYNSPKFEFRTTNNNISVNLQKCKLYLNIDNDKFNNINESTLSKFEKSEENYRNNSTKFNKYNVLNYDKSNSLNLNYNYDFKNKSLINEIENLKDENFLLKKSVEIEKVRI